MNKLEIWICQWLIKRIRKGYEASCTDFEPDCIECQAKKCIEFLQNNITILEEY